MIYVRYISSERRDTEVSVALGECVHACVRERERVAESPVNKSMSYSTLQVRERERERGRMKQLPVYAGPPK